MRYSVSLRIQSECGKILVRKNSDTFYEVRNLFFRHCKKKKKKKRKKKRKCSSTMCFFSRFSEVPISQAEAYSEPRQRSKIIFSRK